MANGPLHRFSIVYETCISSLDDNGDRLIGTQSEISNRSKLCWPRVLDITVSFNFVALGGHKDASLLDAAGVLEVDLAFDLLTNRFITCSIESTKIASWNPSHSNLPFSQRPHLGRLPSYIIMITINI